jgi:hypothetical protein
MPDSGVSFTDSVIVTETTTPTQAYDCEAGRSLDWPAGKKRWCCQHQGRGCPLTRAAGEDRTEPEQPLDEMVNCAAVGTEGQDVQRWSAAVAAWCCLHKGVGCPTTSALTDASTSEDRFWVRKFIHAGARSDEAGHAATSPSWLLACLGCGLLMTVAIFHACSRKAGNSAERKPRNFQPLPFEQDEGRGVV